MSNTKSPDSAGEQSVDGRTDGLDADATLTGPGRTNRLVLVGGIGALVLVVDQVTKVWAASALVERDIDLFWTARFNLHENFGSAFGLGASLGRWLAILIVGVVITMLLYARTVTDQRMLALFGAITGGAVGNLVDRLMRAEDGFMSGGVIDFIDFQWWPIFNVADIAVVCGAIGLMLLSLREPAESQ